MNEQQFLNTLAAARPSQAQCFVSGESLEKWSPMNMADDETTISILDVIGEDFWGEGVTAKRVAAALRKIGDREATVNINSPGGNFFEGLAIYNLLRNHPGKITVNVIGIAASAASFIAMAGDEINVAQAGFLMIHNTQLCACGDRNAFQDLIDTMLALDDVLAGIYAEKSGAPIADISQMLDEETWISGAECVEKGFATGLLEPDKISIENRPDGAEFKSRLVVENALIAQGISRTHRREHVRNVKGTPSAAPNNTRNAVETGLLALLSQAKQI